jgi:hypothetical protein
MIKNIKKKILNNICTGFQHKKSKIRKPLGNCKTIKELLNINFIISIEGTKTKLNYIKGTPCLPNIIQNLKNRN